MQLTFEEELTMHTCPSGHERCTCKTLEGGGHQMGRFLLDAAAPRPCEENGRGTMAKAWRCRLTSASAFLSRRCRKAVPAALGLIADEEKRK